MRPSISIAKIMLMAFICLGLALLGGLGCSKKSESIAGPSETTNGTDITIAGTSLSFQGPNKQSLFIYSKAYHPIYGSGFADTVVSIPNRKTEFTFPDSGSYNLFLFNENGDSGAVRTDIRIDSNHKDTLRIKLDALGSVSGSTATGDTRSAIYIQGSGFAKWLMANGTFQMDGLPQGTFTLKIEEVIKRYIIDGQIHDSALAITILPKDTTTIHFK